MRIHYSFTLLLFLTTFFFTASKVNSQIVYETGNQSTISGLGNNKWRVWLSPKDKWFDTGINVGAGSTVHISAAGSVTWAPLGGRDMLATVGPNATRPPFAEDRDPFPLPDAGCGSLIMRIGSSIFLVGERNSIKTNGTGPIQFMVNDDKLLDNSGGFIVDIQITRIIQPTGDSPSSTGTNGYSVIKASDVTKDVFPAGCGPFLHWNLDKFPGGKIPYYINKKGSKDLSLPEIKTAVEQALDSWKSVEGASLDFVFAGFTNQTGLVPDGKNVIFFDESGSEFNDVASDPFAKTKFMRWEPNGELLEVDIGINGRFIHPTWWLILNRSIGGSCPAYISNKPLIWTLNENRCLLREYRVHLPSTLTHEIGHFIGLGHVTKKGATMSGPGVSDFAENTDESTLGEDDRNGARFLYPSDMRIMSEPVEPYNIASGRPVRVTTNGANDRCNYCEKSWADITDGRFDYEPNGGGQIKDGVVGWQNNDYNESMEVTVTFDLGQTFNVSKIRYATGNVQRAETWNADSMTSPFGRSGTNPGSNRMGVWTEHAGSLRTSKLAITFQKTRKKYEEDWLFIGEIEIIGTPVEDYGSDPIPTLRRRLDANSWEGNVNPRLCWQDTGMSVARGQTVEIAAAGTVTWDPHINPAFGTVGPNGSGYPASRIAAIRQESFLVKNANTGSLIMRVGSLIYAVGKNSRVRMEQGGSVQFMINDEPEWLFDNSGRFFVRVRRE